jgi:hypothetical protein
VRVSYWPASVLRLWQQLRPAASSSTGSLSRRSVEADKIKATFKKGVLEVHLPKAKEAKGKKIEIKAG